MGKVTYAHFLSMDQLRVPVHRLSYLKQQQLTANENRHILGAEKTHAIYGSPEVHPFVDKKHFKLGTSVIWKITLDVVS